MANDFLKQLWPEWEIEGNALGRGSFGVVYKGVRKDNNVESYAAIKVISIPSDPSEVDSLRSEGLDVGDTRTYFRDIVNDFVSEIQLMESLKGLQNIVSIEDYRVVEKSGEIGWNICIRMELLTPFSTIIREKRLTEQEVIKLGCDICTALEICGKRNIIHRDVKPENIFINDFGSYKLGDFGIARKLENMTGGLSHKGAYNYMAPEVIYSTQYDARVDIYSLGIVLYRLLNGNRLPLLDSDQQQRNPSERRNAVDRRIRGEKLPAPCDASPAMAEVILRACAFEPDARFATAAEMKQALLNVANGANEQVDENSASTIHVCDSPTAGDRSMYVQKTPPASRTPAEEIDVETQPPLDENKKKRTSIIAIVTVVMGLLAISLLGTQALPNAKYNNAVALMEKGNYQEAIEAFQAMWDYKDSATKASECVTLLSKETAYQNAVVLMKKGSYQEALSAFKALNDYKDAVSKANEAAYGAYQSANTLQKKGELAKAAIAFGKLGDYKDAKARSFALWDKVAQRDTISAGEHHTVGLKSNGTVVAVGNNDSGQYNVSGWKDIVAISAGFFHTVGLKSDGTVVAVGGNYHGECNVSSWKDIVAISAGSDFTVGLKSDGTVVAVGHNYLGTCNVSGWKDIVAISTGLNFTVGLKSDGTVVAAGVNLDDRYNFSRWKDIVAVSTGDSCIVGLKSDGTVVAVGGNYDGECNVSSWKDIVAISAGTFFTVGLKSDGTVVAVGDNRDGQCNVSGWKNIVAIATGREHTIGLKSDGTVVAVGENYYGQCNVSTWKGIKLPQ